LRTHWARLRGLSGAAEPALMQLFDFRWLARPSGRVISPRIIAIFAAAPFRTVDDAEEAMRHELEPLKDALLAALDLLNERIASREARRLH
jgi:hypothetical protein